MWFQAVDSDRLKEPIISGEESDKKLQYYEIAVLPKMLSSKAWQIGSQSSDNRIEVFCLSQKLLKSMKFG